MASLLCIICGWKPQRRNQRCTTCSAYLRKYGRDRTEEQVVEHGRRVFERSIAC